MLWAAVVQDTFEHDGRTLPRGALVIYREYYGMQPGKPNVGLKLPAEEVAREIVKRETDPATASARRSITASPIRPALPSSAARRSPRR